MTGLGNLIRRNCKLFFKDKAMFFTSLITPMILLVLYATFLAKVYRDSFASSLPKGMDIPQKLIDATAGGELLSSLLAVSCVTVSVCCNALMVQDKVTGARRDLTMTPVRRSTLALSYYFATIISTLIICILALGAGMLYLAKVGWYMSAGDVFLLLSDVVLLVLFGTALSSVINFFLSSRVRFPPLAPSSAPDMALSAVPICPSPSSEQVCKRSSASCLAPTAQACCGIMRSVGCMRKWRRSSSQRKSLKASRTPSTVICTSSAPRCPCLPCMGSCAAPLSC